MRDPRFAEVSVTSPRPNPLGSDRWVKFWSESTLDRRNRRVVWRDLDFTWLFGHVRDMFAISFRSTLKDNCSCHWQHQNWQGDYWVLQSKELSACLHVWGCPRTFGRTVHNLYTSLEKTCKTAFYARMKLMLMFNETNIISFLVLRRAVSHLHSLLITWGRVNPEIFWENIPLACPVMILQDRRALWFWSCRWGRDQKRGSLATSQMWLPKKAAVYDVGSICVGKWMEFRWIELKKTML